MVAVWKIDHVIHGFSQLCMCGFAIDRGRDVEEINFISSSSTGGGSMVMEVCLWQCCLFSASEASQLSGCGRLMKAFGCIPARVNMEWVLSFVRFPEICFLGCEGSWCWKIQC